MKTTAAATMEDLKVYSPYYDLLESKRRECYRRYVAEMHDRGAVAKAEEDFSIGDILDPLLDEGCFEMADDSAGELCFYSPSIRGEGCVKDPRGQYVKVVRPATETEPERVLFLHRSQVFVPQNCAKNLLDMETQTLAISFQVFQSKLAQMSCYLDAKERLNGEMDRLLETYRTLQMSQMGWDLAHDSETDTGKRFFSVDRGTVESLVQRGLITPTREVLTDLVEARPFVAVWHELHNFHRQVHYRWFMPTIDSKTGKFSLERLDLLDGEFDDCGGQYLDAKRTESRISVEEVRQKIADFNGHSGEAIAPGIDGTIGDGLDWLELLNQGKITIPVPHPDCGWPLMQAGYNSFLFGSQIVRDGTGKEFYEFVGKSADQYGDHLDAQGGSPHRPADLQLALDPAEFLEKMPIAEAVRRGAKACYFPRGEVVRICQAIRAEVDRIIPLNQAYDQQCNADNQELQQIFHLSTALLENLDRTFHQNLQNVRA